MSREHFFTGSVFIGPDIEWRDAFHHEPLKGRTEDPLALAFDDAVEMFRSGLKLAHQGDLKAASVRIATAYLMDARSFKLCGSYPHPEAANVALDIDLLIQLLIDCNSTEGSYTSTIMHIAMANFSKSSPSNGQEVIAMAMCFIDDLLDAIEEHPEIENPDQGVLRGLLTRTTLLRMRANLHEILGNYKKTIKDLNKALKIDENYTAARQTRIVIWIFKELKDAATILAEYTRILNEVHEDDQSNEESYASLAIIIMNNPTLGTMDDAKLYYEKCLRSTMRRDELYGRRKKANEPIILQFMRETYAKVQNQELSISHTRRELDDVRQGKKEKSSSAIALEYDTFLEAKKTKTKPKTNNNMHVCIKCGNTADDIEGNLMKCARCKVVSYCSRECQKAVRFYYITFLQMQIHVMLDANPCLAIDGNHQDWKNHQAYCKLSTMNKNPTAPEPKNTT